MVDYPIGSLVADLDAGRLDVEGYLRRVDEHMAKVLPVTIRGEIG